MVHDSCPLRNNQIILHFSYHSSPNSILNNNLWTSHWRGPFSWSCLLSLPKDGYELIHSKSHRRTACLKGVLADEISLAGSSLPLIQFHKHIFSKSYKSIFLWTNLWSSFHYYLVGCEGLTAALVSSQGSVVLNAAAVHNKLFLSKILNPVTICRLFGTLLWITWLYP